MSHSETIPIPICHACGAGAHWDCSRKSNVDAIRRVEGCECDCKAWGKQDQLDQIRADALQDRLAKDKEKEEENNDGEA
jgi:hypothetical protein